MSDTYVIFDPANLESNQNGQTVNLTDTATNYGGSFRILTSRDNGAKLRFYIMIDVSDQLTLQGKFRETDDFINITTYTTSSVVSVDPVPYFRFVRTTGTGTNNTKVVWLGR